MSILPLIFHLEVKDLILLRNKVFNRNINQTNRRYPLTIKGLMERITLLPLNYTRYNVIIVYKCIFCRTKKWVIIINKIGSEKNDVLCLRTYEIREKGFNSFK